MAKRKKKRYHYYKQNNQTFNFKTKFSDFSATGKWDLGKIWAGKWDLYPPSALHTVDAPAVRTAAKTVLS